MKPFLENILLSDEAIFHWSINKTVAFGQAMNFYQNDKLSEKKQMVWLEFTRHFHIRTYLFESKVTSETNCQMLEVYDSEVEIVTQIFVNDFSLVSNIQILNSNFPDNWLFRALISMVWVFTRPFPSPFWVLRILQKRDLRQKLWNNWWYQTRICAAVDEIGQNI